MRRVPDSRRPTIIFHLKSLPTVNGATFFLTDTEDKAEALRSQTLPEIPTNIHVYSAIADIDELDSILTDERMNILQNDKVRTDFVRLIIIGKCTETG
jgi:hypothetical protein